MERAMKELSGRRHMCFLILVLIFLVGCGAGKTAVVKQPETKVSTSFVNLVEEPSKVDVPDDARNEFREKLEHLLYEKGTFQRGPDLEIRYCFMQYDSGHQFTRWFWGGIGSAGKGSLTIEVKYFDATHKELATIHSEGEIGSGALGGDFSFALKKAAEEIVEYTEQNFR
jgi:hypothetical protein